MSTIQLKPLGLLAALLVGASGLFALGLSAQRNYQQMSLATLAVTGACIVLVGLRWDFDLTRLPMLYLILFVFFHFGLIWTLGLFGERRVVRVSETAIFWIRSPHLRPAVTLAALGAFTYSIVAVMCAPRASLSLSTLELPRTEQQRTRRVASVGITLQVAGVAVLGFAVARAGGLALLSGGYLAFLETAQDALTAYAIWALGIGSCLTQIGGRSVRRLGLVIFVCIALILFPLGLRGSVLFPACVILATRSLVGRRVSTPVVLTTAILVLAASAVVRTTRVGQSSTSTSEGLIGGVVSTTTELGFSIRPTAEVVAWTSRGQEPSYFVSFIAVPIRLFERITGLGGGAPAMDMRLFNVKINSLVGPIGGSPVAEGYDAAGVIGVVLVLAVISLVLTWAAKRPLNSAQNLAMFPVVALPFVIAVRNSFAPVLTQIVLGYLVVKWTCHSSTQGGGVARQCGVTHENLLPPNVASRSETHESVCV